MTPATLNGYPVVATAPRPSMGENCHYVIVHRKCHPAPDYVTATWTPNMDDEWCWGHYCKTFDEAMNFYSDARWHFPNGVPVSLKCRVAATVMSQLVDEAYENRHLPDASFARIAGCDDADVYNWCLSYLGKALPEN